MGWRYFLSTSSVDFAVFEEFVPNKTKQKPQKPQKPHEVVTELDMFDPEVIKIPRPDLLTEAELEAFNGWYASCRKPKFGMDHEEAMQKSWRLAIESIQIIYKEQGKRI